MMLLFIAILSGVVIKVLATFATTAITALWKKGHKKTVLAGTAFLVVTLVLLTLAI